MGLIEAGLAVHDITPQPGLPMWGYSDRSGPAAGVLDPLFAKTVAFRAERKTIAWVALDLGRPPLRRDCDAVRERLRGRADHIVFHATHTHHAPMMEFIEDPHRQRMVDTIVECVEEAVRQIRPVRFGFTTAEIDIAHNRRRITPDGRCLMLWRNERRLPTQPLDKQATIIKLEEASGAPLAYLVHYACHPVVLGPSNREYSADWPGEMCRMVEGITGVPCIFLQGACGDINPYLDKTPMDQGGLDALHTTGRIAAEAVMAAIGRIETQPINTPPFGIAESEVDVGVRWDLGDSKTRELLRNAHPGLYDRYISKLGAGLTVSTTALRLGDQLALAGVPGEPFVQQQLELKRDPIATHTLLCGYVNDYHAYFPPIPDAAAGGYGGSIATYVGLGAAERLLVQAKIDLYRLGNRLGQRCSESDLTIRDAPSAIA